MDHIGIDLGSRESQVCVRTAAGNIVEEVRCRTTELGPWLMARTPARVIVESCTEAFRLAGLAQQHGHDVRVVAATLVRSLGVGQRGLKNDARDACVLSEASCRIDLPSVHIPTVMSQEVKSICVSREALVRMRTQLVNRVRSYLRSRMGHHLRATPETLPGKVRRTLLADSEGLPAHLDRVLVVLETLRDQIAAADAELKARARRRSDAAADVGTGCGPRHGRTIRRRIGRRRPVPQRGQRGLLLGLDPRRDHDRLSD
jgi:transposase